MRYRYLATLTCNSIKGGLSMQMPNRSSLREKIKSDLIHRTYTSVIFLVIDILLIIVTYALSNDVAVIFFTCVGLIMVALIIDECILHYRYRESIIMNRIHDNIPTSVKVQPNKQLASSNQQKTQASQAPKLTRKDIFSEPSSAPVSSKQASKVAVMDSSAKASLHNPSISARVKSSANNRASITAKISAIAKKKTDKLLNQQTKVSSQLRQVIQSKNALNSSKATEASSASSSQGNNFQSTSSISSSSVAVTVTDSSSIISASTNSNSSKSQESSSSSGIMKQNDAVSSSSNTTDDAQAAPFDFNW